MGTRKSRATAQPARMSAAARLSVMIQDCISGADDGLPLCDMMRFSGLKTLHSREAAGLYDHWLVLRKLRQERTSGSNPQDFQPASIHCRLRVMLDPVYRAYAHNNLIERIDPRIACIDDAKEGKSCPRCGFAGPPCCFDFHHVDPLNKQFNIAHARFHCQKYTLEDIQNEMRKCKLLCSNCHRAEHFGPASFF